ncbi:MAG: hypothetical protein GQ570_11150 [Helicobacteraceae bacterium]|nr:hypothetical protein [Helicobacteraceae bacterium]
MKVILSRYFLYVFIGLEVLLLPVLLPRELYVEIEYNKFILYFIPFLLFGANSGYVYFKYNKNKDYFYSLIFFASIYFAVVACIIYFLTSNFLFSLASFFIVIFMIMEQKVKTEKYFFLAMSIKPLISLSLLALASLTYYNLYSFNLDILYYAVLLAFCIWLLFVVILLKNKLIVDFNIKFKFYVKLIKKGFLINIGTLLLMVIFFTDRYFTKEYYNDYLATYSFSYNLVQFIIIALTTLAYVNVVEIGEKIKSLDILFLKQKLLYSYKIFGLLYVLFIGFIFIINDFYSFQDLVVISLLMGFFLGSFYSINSLASVAIYKDLLPQVTQFLFLVMLINLLSSNILVNYEINYIFFIIKSGILLNAYSMYLIYVISRGVKVCQ